MPTAAERQALAFLAAVALLGAGVRALDARRFEHGVALAASATDSAGNGVTTQLSAIDSVRSHIRSRTRPANRTTRQTGADAPTERPDSPRRTGQPRATPPPDPVDVDVATADELERLPRIGPALAQRIVADRDSFGAFGSLDALTRVRGIGPALAKRLAPTVTFSGRPSPFHGVTRKSRHPS